MPDVLLRIRLASGAEVIGTPLEDALTLEDAEGNERPILFEDIEEVEVIDA